jgi:hypothetical protein
MRRQGEIQDCWKHLKKSMRQLCNGMGANMDGQIKRRKRGILQHIKRIDEMAENRDLSWDEWRVRYKFEGDWNGFTITRMLFSNRGAVSSGL